MEGKRAVLFDVGNVLIQWDPTRVYRPLFEREADLDHFLAEVCDPEWNRAIDAGRPFAEAVRERQREMPEYAELIGFWWSRWEDMLGGEVPGTVALLGQLKAQGTPLYALSNWSKETFPTARVRFPFLDWFEEKVVSGFVGLAKPDPAIYRLAIERCGLTPALTVFIDDSQPNVDAALGLGFDALLFTGAERLRADLVERSFIPR
jgi:2-haloacid dehalogenase